MFTHEGYADHEKVFMFNDLGGRLKGMIAIHSTVLGPSLGGCRFWQYDHPNDALNDVLRLSEGMTYKNACANLPIGGGKAVLFSNGFDGRDRKELFECFGWHINELGGQYYTAIDVGTTLEDMKAVADATPYVCGVRREIGGSTARGAFNAIKGLVHFKYRGMEDLTVAVQGLGKTGMGLVKLLHEAGVGKIIAADINADAEKEAEEKYGAVIVPVSQLIYSECDILAPCALGGVFSSNNVEYLQCTSICGIANNQLTNEVVAQLLMNLGITYVPDFVVNAGGVIAAADEVIGGESVMHEIDNIEKRVISILGEGVILEKTPLEITMNMVERKMLTP